ncbi:hypothetical protein ABZ883_21945 [Streptomyces sp. NPDC046977]|uniref:hypothetical protein n=1 Tax=Streptomyces sp. NPDC046977 TaxID=3154703 RepID=UPI0033F668CB
MARILADLALGPPAAVPLSPAPRWTLTAYLPMDCRSIADAAAPGFSGTRDHHVLDHAGPGMFLALPLVVHA